MNLIHGSKQSLKITMCVARVNFMHYRTYLQVIYVIHFKQVKLLRV